MAPADAVELAEHAALQQRPEPLDGVRVNVAVYLPVLMLDDGVRQNLRHAEVGFVLVSDQRGLAGVNAVADEGAHVPALHLVLLHGLGRHLAASLNGADHGSLLGAPAARVASVWPVALGALARLAPDVRLVHLDDAGEQVPVLGLRHRLADLHRDPPSRVLVHLQVAGQLQRGQALLGVQHERDRQKPFLEWQVGVMEDRADRDAEAGLAVVAAMAVLVWGGIGRSAVGADRPIGPARGLQMGDAALLSGKPLENLYDVHGIPFRLVMTDLVTGSILAQAGRNVKTLF